MPVLGRTVARDRLVPSILAADAIRPVAVRERWLGLGENLRPVAAHLDADNLNLGGLRPCGQSGQLRGLMA